MPFFYNQPARRARATGGRVLLMLALSGSAWGQCFKPEQPYTVGSSPYSIKAGDFNGDGHLDLVTANEAGDNVSVLLALGDGTFANAVDYPVGDMPYRVAVGDFNGDGHLDLVTANVGGNSISVLLGVGDGTFNAAQSYGAGTSPSAVEVADFDKDGKQDLAVTTNAQQVFVRLGLGDGTFGQASVYNVGFIPYTVRAGDFDGDGHLDLVTANYGDGTVSVLLGNGDGTFDPATDYGAGGGANDVAVGDLDADGDLDLATTNYNVGTVSVLLNGGSGTFGPATDYGIGDFPHAVAIGDVTGDGKADVVATKLSAPPILLLPGAGDGTLGNAQGYSDFYSAFSVLLADLNADGKLDLVAGHGGSVVSVYLNSLPPPTIALGGVPLCPGQSLTLTLAVTCPDAGTYSAQLSDASGSFNNPTALGAVAVGSNSLVIPANAPFGTGYRIRVVSSTPNVVSEPSGAFTVNAVGEATVVAPPTVPARTCVGDPLPVTFATTTPCVPTDRVFTVQLSNPVGSFANPTVLGPASPGTTALTLPQNLPLGSGYRVRILSGGQTSPASAAFRLEGPSLSGVTPTVSGAPVCRGQALTVSFQVSANSCAFPDGNTFTAQLSSASGSFVNAVSLGPVVPGGASVTIPAGVAAGTGYRIRIVSSNPALTSSNSSLFRINACVSRLSVEEPELVVMPNPVSGGEIRVRVSGMENPAFRLTTSAGRSVGFSEKTDGLGEFILTPGQALAPGLYLVQASEGGTRITRRVLVSH